MVARSPFVFHEIIFILFYAVKPRTKAELGTGHAYLRE